MKRTLPPLSAIRSFEAAARHLSFKDAAEELNVTQSAVSHQVRGLEEFLGRSLFFRAAAGVTLTTAGEDYFGDLSSILDQLDASTRRNRARELSGPLHVRATPAFAARWLIGRIKAFNGDFPDIELQVTTSIETTDFRKDDVDILLQYGEQSAQGLRVEPFLSSSRIPVCTPKMLAGAPSIDDPEDLLRHTLLRDMVGGSYTRSLKETFIPELVSMNLLMTGMIPTMKFLMPRIGGAGDPFQPAFWFTMSMALIVGFALAYPINWWLVVNNMKHGMLTVRPVDGSGAEEGAHQARSGHGDAGETSGHGGDVGSTDSGPGGHDEHGGGKRPGSATILAVTVISFAFLAAGLWLAGGFF